MPSEYTTTTIIIASDGGNIPTYIATPESGCGPGVELRVLSRSPITVGLVAAIFGVLACSAATARVDTKVRVLLYSGSDPIRVGRVAAPVEIALDAQGDLVIAGRSHAKRWAPTGSGPWRVGSRIVRGEIIVRARRQRIEVLNRIVDADVSIRRPHHTEAGSVRIGDIRFVGLIDRKRREAPVAGRAVVLAPCIR